LYFNIVQIGASSIFRCMCTTLHSAQQWAQAEFGLAELRDKRRSKRLVQVASALAQCPSGTLPQALPDWKALKGAYRLFSNPAMDAAAVLAPHCQRTRQQCLEVGEYLWIEDTTELDFTHHRRCQGLGQVGNQYGRGLHLHTSLAVRVESWTLEQTPEITVVGVLGQKCWARVPAPSNRGQERWRERMRRPRESQRWAQVLEHMPARPREVTWIYMADRESDLYEVFEQCRTKQVDFVVRARCRRALVGSDDSAFEAVAKAPLLGRFELDLRGREGQAARRAKVEVRAVAVILYGAWGAQGTRLPLAVNVVEAREVDAPAGVEAIRWVLFSSLAINRLAEVQRIIGRYAKRWIIEEYHKALKTGANIEASQLESAQRLQIMAALLAVVAVRLLNTKLLAGTRAQGAVDVQSFSPEIIQILTMRFGQPAGGWTYGTLLVAIARMGGFLARRHDGNPGWLTIWRGWNRLTVMAEGLMSSREEFRGKQALRCG
jgi:hypothetical protein